MNVGGRMGKIILRGPHGLPVDDEQELVTQARNESSAAVEELIRRYESRVFHRVQNIIFNYEDAQDVVQVFAKAFQNLASFRGDSRFYTWLVRIAVNEALMKIRGQHFGELSIDDPTDAEDHGMPRQLEDCRPNPEERCSAEELGRILGTTMSKLTPRYRIVCQLHDLEGLTTGETAQVLGLSLTAVKSRLRRARLRLRKSLYAHFRIGNAAASWGVLVRNVRFFRSAKWVRNCAPALIAHSGNRIAAHAEPPIP